MASGMIGRAVLGTVLALALAGCSTAPYRTSGPTALTRQLQHDRRAKDKLLEERRARDPSRTVEKATPGPAALSFCYNSLVNTPEQLLEEARFNCPKGEVRYLDSDLIWTPCSLLQPSRATFFCTPVQASETEGPATR